MHADSASISANPLLQPWTAHHGLPPFDRVTPADFVPAFDVVLQQHAAEVEQIANQVAPPSFENTIAALDAAGRDYVRVDLLFHNLKGNLITPALQAVETEMMPRLAAHDAAVYLNVRLFARIDALHRERHALGLDAEQLRLLERMHLNFVRAGAQLTGAARERFAASTERLASLLAQFSQNVQADEARYEIVLTDEADLDGLPDFLRAAAARAAQQRDLPTGHYVIALTRSMVFPYLTFAANRARREQVWRAWVDRGAHAGEFDNRPICAEIIRVRLEQAQLLGEASFADFALRDRMAKTPAGARNLLEQLWAPALDSAASDRALLTRTAERLGLPTPITAWDWRFLAEKVRQTHYALDDAEIKPYFALDNMINAMFDCAGKLFGLRFIEQHGVPLYHPDARLWEVWRGETMVGQFIGDMFARPGKSGGAWMSVFRSQSGIGGGVMPIVVNNCNFAKGEPTLLSVDDVRTLFHEFGHGLHGMLSNVRHEHLAGTQTLRDFSEMPSKLFEHWGAHEAVLRQHARHAKTGEAIPQALLDKLQRARRFNLAYETVQAVAPALIDLALHGLTDASDLDIAAFEAQQCAQWGVPTDIGVAHRLPHFTHLFSGYGYAAGYYNYLWAEVFAVDAFDAFLEVGNPFDAQLAAGLEAQILSRGNSVDPATAYRAFRGRDARVEPLLRKRGLAA
ncbi:MAG: M3 family metallopeptidase [Burkholderiales bacterium]|nr:M3 family metallopeptidase [Burkholderiales bacterium]